MALSANTQREFQTGIYEDYPVAAAVDIFSGAAVGSNGVGYARPLQAGDVFLGFAVERASNASGGAGDLLTRVQPAGRIVLDVAGVSDVAANSRPAVYAVDDGSFTLTASTNSLIGYVSRWVVGSTCVVEFDASAARAAHQ